MRIREDVGHLRPRAFPPTHGVTVGQLVPRRRSSRGVLAVMTVAVLTMAATGLVSLGRLWAPGTSTDPGDTAYLLTFAVLLAMFVAVTVDTYLASRVTELTAQLDTDGIRLAAGRYAQHLPWHEVAELRVVRGRSGFPVLCVVPQPQVRFRPPGLGWRLKLRVHRRLFGTPLAFPLAGTGVDEAGALAVAREYVDRLPEQDAPRLPAPAGAPAAGWRGLAAAAAASTTVAVGAVWASAVAALLLLPAGPEGVFLGIAAVAGAVAATVTLVPRAAVGFALLVPVGGGAVPQQQPVLRVGPDGLTYVLRGRSRQLPWTAVRRVYLSGPRESRWLCAQPSPPAGHPGDPIAVPLAGSGVAEEDVLDLVRHFAPAEVDVG